MPLWMQTAVDSPRAVSLLTEYFSSRAAGFPLGQGAYQATFPVQQDFEAPHGVFLVVCDDTTARDNTHRHEAEPVGADVGCGGIRRVTAGANGDVRFEVKHLYLRPQTRGKGIGRALLTELENMAVRFGASELVLDTNASLTAAAGLYNSAGFESIAPYNDNPNATNWYGKQLGQ